MEGMTLSPELMKTLATGPQGVTSYKSSVKQMYRNNFPEL